MAATAHAVAISPFEFIFCAKALLSRTAKTARRRAYLRTNTRITQECTYNCAARRTSQAAHACADSGFFGCATRGLACKLCTLGHILVNAIGIRIVIRIGGWCPSALAGKC